jgi:DNA-binding HxlR family transcriptional regulator
MSAIDISAFISTSMEDIDETIHQKVRLGIMSALVVRGQSDFRYLRDALGLTDGNLSIHLARLEEAGYITVQKEFLQKKPHTSYTATETGTAAFDRYLNALERIIQSGRRGK